MNGKNLFAVEFSVTEIKYVWNGIYMPRSDRMENCRYHSLVLIRSDQHTYRFDDGTELHAEPGYILYLPEGSSYRISDIKTCDCVAINFKILEKTNIPPLRFSVKNQISAYSELFQTASRFWDRKTTGYQAKIKSLLYQILYTMQTNYHPDYVPSRLAFKLNAAMEYISDHYTDSDITVQMLAGMADMSEVYFRRQFNRLYGTPPMQYIKKLRMNKAVELLDSDMYPVHEVAHRVGYASEHYFCREFKKSTGLSPKKYEKEKNSEPSAYPFRTHENAPTPKREDSIVRLLGEERIVTYLPFDGSAAAGAGRITAREGGRLRFVEGYFGQAAQFDDGCVTLDGWQPGRNSFSVALWMKTDGVLIDPCLLSNKDWMNGNNPGFVLALRASNVKFNAGNGSAVRLDQEYPLPRDFHNGWVYVILVVDREAGEVRISCDFEAFKSAAIPTALRDVSLDTPLQLNIGQDGTGKFDLHLSATLDEYLIVDGVLTDADVAALKTHYAP